MYLNTVHIYVGEYYSTNSCEFVTENGRFTVSLPCEVVAQIVDIVTQHSSKALSNLSCVMVDVVNHNTLQRLKSSEAFSDKFNANILRITSGEDCAKRQDSP